MAIDEAYLEKKIEALEILYSAEKQRGEEVQRLYRGFDDRFRQLEGTIKELADYLSRVPRKYY